MAGCNITSQLCAPDGSIVIVNHDLSTNQTTYITTAGVPWAGNPSSLGSCAPGGNEDCNCIIVSANNGNVLTPGTDGGAFFDCNDVAACVPTPTIVSANNGNLIQIGTDGGAYIDCNSISACTTSGGGTKTITLNGSSDGVTVSGSNCDLITLSTSAGNDLGLGSDGGLYFNLCDDLQSLPYETAVSSLSDYYIGIDSSTGRCVRFPAAVGGNGSFDLCDAIKAIPQATGVATPQGTGVELIGVDVTTGECKRYFPPSGSGTLDLCAELTALPLTIAGPSSGDIVFGIDSNTGNCVRWTHKDLCDEIKAIPQATGVATPAGTGVELIGVDVTTGECKRYFPPSGGDADFCAYIGSLQQVPTAPPKGGRMLIYEPATGDCNVYNAPLDRISKTWNFLGCKDNLDGRVYEASEEDCIYGFTCHHDHRIECISVLVCGDSASVAQDFELWSGDCTTGARQIEQIITLPAATNCTSLDFTVTSQTTYPAGTDWRILPRGMPAGEGSTVTSVTVEYCLL